MVANVVASFIAKKALSSAISQGQDGGKSRIRNVVDLSFPEIDAGLALGGDVTAQGLDSLGASGTMQLAGASDVSGPLPSGARAAPPAQLGTPTKASSSKKEEPTTKTKQREQKKLETSPTDTAPEDDLGQLLEVFLDQKFENVKAAVSSLAALGRSDTTGGSQGGTS